MSFRARIAIASAGAVALAVIVASAVVYVVARGELRAPIVDALERRADELKRHQLVAIEGPGGELFLGGVGPGFGEAQAYVQLVKSDGTVILPPEQELELPVGDDVREIAGVEGEESWTEPTIDGEHMLVLTVAYGPNTAVQVARPLTEVDQSLERLGLFLLLIAGTGVAVAAALGLVVSRAALAPVRRLTGTAEKVTATGDLSERIEVTGRDELSRLAASFNSMLAALEESMRAQRQLVADASHELRTPLTSLRTNIEVLASDHALPSGERSRLLSDVVEQLGEMTTLIAELIELARAEQQTVKPEDVRLDLAAADALERARRNHPEITFSATLEDSVVHGVPSTIERAIANLLDNAAKWSRAGGEVELTVADGTVVVRDHGPGIDDEDLPYVFDRFYRARAARGMRGSGLGLAIVRQVAEAHGGEVTAERAEDGGTRMTLRLDGVAAVNAEPASESS
ncbi:MAG TPA: HAMP domain-containing sensor histidine kinase [Gaiellaceae bacterium]